MRGIRTTVVALTLAGVLLAIAGCGSGGTTTVTTTVTAEESTSSPTEETSTEATAETQTFHGSGQKNLGTITVPDHATVSWECESCKNTNFIIENAESDANLFPTNGLEQTQGVEPLSPGTYHTVVVETTAGPWTVTIESE
jgi:hypothetical protein